MNTSAATDTPTGLVQLHLGLGNFHRAHQAMYLQRLHDQGDTRWTLAGGNLRPDPGGAVDALIAQGGAYTLETISPAGEHQYQHITAIRQVIAHQHGIAPLVALAATPAVRIISFTVTEAGYYLDDQHRLDTRLPDIQADLDAARRQTAGQTIYGAVTAMLRARRAGGAGPVTLMNCDNLRHNGERFRAGLLDFIAALAMPSWRPGCRPTPRAPMPWSTASRRARRPPCASA